MPEPVKKEVKEACEAIDLVVQTKAGLEAVLSHLLEKLEFGILSGPQTLSAEERVRCLRALPQPPVYLHTTRTMYPDTREGVEPHEVISYEVRIPEEITLKNLLVKLLGGKEARELLTAAKRMHGGKIDEFMLVAGVYKATLFLDSDSKHRSKQEEDLRHSIPSHSFADDLTSIIITAAALYEVRHVGLDVYRSTSHWDFEQADILKLLNSDVLVLLEILKKGVLRTLGGEVSVSGYCLVVNDLSSQGPDRYCVAFGTPTK